MTRIIEIDTRLDVHIEKTGFVTSNFANALPELKRQTPLAGCDAIIEIAERRRQLLETMVYHVTALVGHRGELWEPWLNIGRHPDSGRRRVA